MRKIILFTIILLIIPFASAFVIKTTGWTTTPLQNINMLGLKDGVVITQLPSWNETNDITGEISFSQMWGSPMYVKRTNTSQIMNVSRPSYVSRALTRGGTTLYFRDMAVGNDANCVRGATRCENNTFIRCVGGFWESTEKCKRNEICTPSGCRMIRWSRYPLVRITPISIGKTIGAA